MCFVLEILIVNFLYQLIVFIFHQLNYIDNLFLSLTPTSINNGKPIYVMNSFIFSRIGLRIRGNDFYYLDEKGNKWPVAVGRIIKLNGCR
jgi:hypothetical protein